MVSRSSLFHDRLAVILFFIAEQYSIVYVHIFLICHIRTFLTSMLVQYLNEVITELGSCILLFHLLHSAGFQSVFVCLFVCLFWLHGHSMATVAQTSQPHTCKAERRKGSKRSILRFCFLFIEGKYSYNPPCQLHFYLIGQNSVTWSPLAAREAGKSNWIFQPL